jgi:hypothetical protein
MAAIAVSIIGCGGSPAASVAPAGGDSSEPTATLADGGAASAAPTAASSSAAGGPGSAHYEITGPNAASGDVAFLWSTLSSKYALEAPGTVQQLVFQDAAAELSIYFPVPSCSSDFPQTCGIVKFTSFGNPGFALGANGWHQTPLPEGPSCTWDMSQLTPNGGTGSVECNEAINSRDLKADPNTIKITFTYTDPAPTQL